MPSSVCVILAALAWTIQELMGCSVIEDLRLSRNGAELFARSENHGWVRVPEPIHRGAGRRRVL